MLKKQLGLFSSKALKLLERVGNCFTRQTTRASLVSVLLTREKRVGGKSDYEALPVNHYRATSPMVGIEICAFHFASVRIEATIALISSGFMVRRAWAFCLCSFAILCLSSWRRESCHALLRYPCQP